MRSCCLVWPQFRIRNPFPNKTCFLGVFSVYILSDQFFTQNKATGEHLLGRVRSLSPCMRSPFAPACHCSPSLTLLSFLNLSLFFTFLIHLQFFPTPSTSHFRGHVEAVICVCCSGAMLLFKWQNLPVWRYVVRSVSESWLSRGRRLSWSKFKLFFFSLLPYFTVLLSCAQNVALPGRRVRK